MAYQATTIVVFDNSVAIARDLARQAADLRHLTALRILQAAQANAPEESGALKASGYLVDEFFSGYADAAAAAQEKNDAVELLAATQPERDTTIIAFAVAYAEENEYYTGPANPGAHPYLTPATEAERATFDSDVAGLGRAV